MQAAIHSEQVQYKTQIPEKVGFYLGANMLPPVLMQLMDDNRPHGQLADFRWSLLSIFQLHLPTDF